MTLPGALSNLAASRSGVRWYFNASAIARDGRGALILGRPGAGKSSLALALLGLGATLVSDDGVWAEACDDGQAMLVRPDKAPDLIEARGVGLLRSGPVIHRVALTLVVDLDAPEDQRLPPERTICLGDHDIPLVHGRDHPGLAPPVMQMLRFGRSVV